GAGLGRPAELALVAGLVETGQARDLVDERVAQVARAVVVDAVVDLGRAGVHGRRGVVAVATGAEAVGIRVELIGVRVERAVVGRVAHLVRVGVDPGRNPRKPGIGLVVGARARRD